MHRALLPFEKNLRVLLYTPQQLNNHSLLRLTTGEGRMDCEHTARCGFFRKFQGRESLVRRGMVKKHCQQGEECARRMMFDAGYLPPSDDLMPVGVHASKAFLSLP